MLFLLSTFWFIRETKAILFWLYLWQLKEYHIGRFLDHFRTEKGEKLLINKLIFLKILLFLAFLLTLFVWSPVVFRVSVQYHPLLPYVFQEAGGLIFGLSLIFLFVLYLLETGKFLTDYFQKKLIKPVLTKKTAFLISVALVLEILFLFILFQYIEEIIWYALGILVFDILTPLIVSAIVLIFQPLAVLGRNQIIRKAIKKREQFKDLLVIGITGSYGKTSTKEFLATILSEKFKVLKTAEHQNSEVGISQCILNDLKPEHEIFIVEMGAYNRGGIKLLCDIAKPKIGILTGINEQHLATFGSLENIIKGKYELIESLPEDGLSIFNGDNEYCFELYKKTLIKKRVYSLQSSISGLPSDIWAYNIRAEKDFITFKMTAGDEMVDFRVSLLGSHNISNILAAVCCARELGMTLEEISRACQKIESWQSGIQLKRGRHPPTVLHGINIFDATYSANPDGVISHLEYLKIWPGKKVIIMPCLIELGSSSKEVHRRIGEKIGEVCNLAIITTKERFEEIKEGAIGRGMNSENILFIENPKKIFEKIKVFCKEGDVVLLESRLPNQLIQQLLR